MKKPAAIPLQGCVHTRQPRIATPIAFFLVVLRVLSVSNPQDNTVPSMRARVCRLESLEHHRTHGTYQLTTFTACRAFPSMNQTRHSRIQGDTGPKGHGPKALGFLRNPLRGCQQYETRDIGCRTDRQAPRVRHHLFLRNPIWSAICPSTHHDPHLG